MTEVVNLKSLDYNKITFKAPLKQGNFYYSPITYNSESPLYVETPNVFCDETLVDCGNTLRVKLSPEDFSVYDKFLNIDETNVQRTLENSENWFKKDLPEDIVRTMYKRITEPLVKDDLPKVELRIPKIKDKFQCGVFDKDGIPLAKEEIKTDCEIKCILHIKGLKFLKKYFYCDMYITQIKVATPKVYSIPEKCLFKEEDDPRLGNPEDIIDERMIQELEEEERKKNMLLEKRKEMNVVKDEIKILETKLEVLMKEYNELNINFV